MDVHSIVHDLNWVYGVSLKLDRDKRRLRISKRDATRLPPELIRGIKEHHDELLRGELFKDAHLRFQRWMSEKRGADPDGPECAAGRQALGEGGTYERLNEAWYEDDLEGFKEALSEYVKAGARGFNSALKDQRVSGPLVHGTRRKNRSGISSRTLRTKAKGRA